MGGSTDNPKDPVLPYARFFDKTNPVQWNCFVAALVMASIRVLSRLVLDFTIGMPQDAFEWFSVFFYYFLDILILPVGYLFLEYVVLELFVQAEKRNHSK